MSSENQESEAPLESGEEKQVGFIVYLGQCRASEASYPALKPATSLIFNQRLTVTLPWHPKIKTRPVY